MKVVHLSDVPAMKVTMDGAKDVVKQLPLGSADGAPHFSFRVFTIGPGGNTPYHTHAAEHLNYVISGTGALVNGEGGETPLRAGHFALVLPDEKHCYRNTSADEALVMICAVPKEFE